MRALVSNDGGKRVGGFPGAHGFLLPAGLGTSSPGVMSPNGLLSLFVLLMYHSSSCMVSLLDMMYLRSLFQRLREVSR